MTPAEVPRKVDLKTLLARRTSGGRYLPSIDGLRFLAIAAVFFYHLLGQMQTKDRYEPAIQNDAGALHQILSHGTLGVQLFFIISAFILGLPFASYRLLGQRKVNLRAFYLRRLTRLEPPYLITSILFFLALPLVTPTPWAEAFPHLLASLTYSNGLVYHSLPLINVVTWSLEVEVQFYLLVPLFASVYVIRSRAVRRGLLIGLAIASDLVIRAVSAHPNWLDLTLFGHLQYFALGMLAADIFVADFGANPPEGAKWDVLALLACGLLILGEGGAYLPLATACGLFLLVLAGLLGRRFKALLSLPVLTTIGGMCYTIYLLHFTIISAVSRGSMKLRVGHALIPNFLLQTVLIGFATLAISALFFLLVEKPCMNPNWPQDLRARFRPRAVSAPDN